MVGLAQRRGNAVSIAVTSTTIIIIASIIDVSCDNLHQVQRIDLAIGRRAEYGGIEIEPET